VKLVLVVSAVPTSAVILFPFDNLLIDGFHPAEPFLLGELLLDFLVTPGCPVTDLAAVGTEIRY
jgi:hypothetical protein